MKTDADGKTRISTNQLIAWTIGFAIVFVIAISMVAASGNADPTDVAPGAQSKITSVVNASVIVFREGLEAVLIFAAITASFLGKRRGYRRPVLLGVASAFIATVLTWFLMTTVVHALPFSQDVLLAVTGLIAVVVLLLVMNWFFHKVYWTDHIKELNSKKRNLVVGSETGEKVKFWGFVALGFTAVYREGFEVVLFLQNLNLVAGGEAVFFGVLFGLAATSVVGFLTFFLHHKLPYKKMLVLTGVLLGVVLVVMIGGSARTLQDLGVLGNHPLPFGFPDWWARWFEMVPTYETMAVQFAAGAFVVGSYCAAEWWSKEKRRRARESYVPETETSTSLVLASAAGQPVAVAEETLCGEPVLTEYVITPRADESGTVRSAVAAATAELPVIDWQLQPVAAPATAPVEPVAESSTAPAAPTDLPVSACASNVRLRPTPGASTVLAGTRPAPFTRAPLMPASVLDATRLDD